MASRVPSHESLDSATVCQWPTNSASCECVMVSWIGRRKLRGRSSNSFVFKEECPLCFRLSEQLLHGAADGLGKRKRDVASIKTRIGIAVDTNRWLKHLK